MSELTELERRALDEATEAKHALYKGMQALREVVGGLRRSENKGNREPTFTGIEEVKSDGE